MIYGVPWAEFVFLAVVFVCGCWGLRGEFKPGGAFAVPADDGLADLFELPLPDGVEAYDVLATLDWIEAL